MYQVNNNWNKKGKLDDIIIEGFSMGPNNKVYKIKGAEVKAIKISNKELAYPVASKMVSTKYSKLVNLITSILIEEDEDPTGDTYREALNHIEKFRLEIKNRYRDYLKRKELDIMAKQLMILQKELTERLIQLRENYLNIKEGKRSR